MFGRHRGERFGRLDLHRIAVTFTASTRNRCVPSRNCITIRRRYSEYFLFRAFRADMLINFEFEITQEQTLRYDDFSSQQEFSRVAR